MTRNATRSSKTGATYLRYLPVNSAWVVLWGHPVTGAILAGPAPYANMLAEYLRITGEG